MPARNMLPSLGEREPLAPHLMLRSWLRKQIRSLFLLMCSAGKKKVSLHCHSQLGAFNRSDVISRLSIHIRFPSLNICLTYSPMGTGCVRKALRGQPPAASLSTSVGSWPRPWLFFQQFSLQQPHTPAILPPAPLGLGV